MTVCCPQCQSEWVEIRADIMATVGSGGIDYADIDARDTTPRWTDQSFCRCKDCDYAGMVADFIR